MQDDVVSASDPPAATPAPGIGTACLPDAETERIRARVLLVEDNAVNQRIASLMLLRAGVETEIAGNGREALAQLQAGTFDLVFMDVQMPEMDGFEAAAAIRARETASGGARLPIVAMTASAMSGDRERCLEAGMDDYVSKPFIQSDLLAALRRWVPAGLDDVNPERG